MTSLAKSISHQAGDTGWPRGLSTVVHFGFADQAQEGESGAHVRRAPADRPAGEPRQVLIDLVCAGSAGRGGSGRERGTPAPVSPQQRWSVGPEAEPEGRSPCTGSSAPRIRGRGQGTLPPGPAPVLPEAGTCPGQRSPCVPRKQEELVQQVRKRLEEALMADMLAHVEELARDGEAPLDKPGADEEEEDDEDEDEDEPDQDQEMEHV